MWEASISGGLMTMPLRSSKSIKMMGNPISAGERCWQLRCEYLHQNKGFSNEEKGRNVRFHLGINCGTSVCKLDTAGRTNGNMDIRIDIEQFCLRMCQAAKAYYEKNHREKSFGLYNTPVLDFIERSAPTADSWKTVALMCSDSAYGLALQGHCRTLQISSMYSPHLT